MSVVSTKSNGYVSSFYRNNKDKYQGEKNLVLPTADVVPKKSVDPLPLKNEWQIQTLANAYAERPQRPELVSGLIPEGSLIIVHSPPGCLKSMLLGDLAVHVASGQAWLPKQGFEAGYGFKTNQARVLWVDVDNGKNRTADIFAALGKGSKVSEEAPLNYISFPQPYPNFNDRDFTERLCDLITCNQVKLLVLDNLSQMSGEVDENSNHMASVMRNLRWICEESGCAIIVIHHSRKGNGQSARAGDNLRGHSSIEAAVDLALYVDRNGDTVAVKPTKTRGYGIETFYATFKYTHKENTKELEAAHFNFSSSQKGQEEEKIDSAIQEYLTQNGDTKKTTLVQEISSSTDFGRKKVTTRIEYLVNNERLGETQGERNSKIISLI